MSKWSRVSANGMASFGVKVRVSVRGNIMVAWVSKPYLARGTAAATGKAML